MYANKKCLIHHFRFFSSASRPFISLKLTPNHFSFPFQDKVSLLNTKNGTEKFLTQTELRPILSQHKTLYMTTGPDHTLTIK